MKTFRAQSGPFVERPYYEDQEIESIAVDELRRVGLLPSSPEPIRVERFIEKRFGIVPKYDDLPEGLLGFTRFGSKGVEEVVVSRALSEEGNKVAERRMNSTLAHEAGHMLLHGHLFVLERRARSLSLFNDDLDEVKQKILCRAGAAGTPAEITSGSRYDGRWWEFQANKVIGALLLPRPLVNEALNSVLVSQGRLGTKTLDASRREEAVQLLAGEFDVNPAVARIRVDAIFLAREEGQLTL